MRVSSATRGAHNLQLAGDHHEERYGAVSLFDEHLTTLYRHARARVLRCDESVLALMSGNTWSARELVSGSPRRVTSLIIVVDAFAALTNYLSERWNITAAEAVLG